MCLYMEECILTRSVLYCREFERFLTRYKGSARLDLWYQYILWMSSNMKPSRAGLTICLQCLADDDTYKHDRRYIALWIMYVSKLRRHW
jgi:hypothetical protein